MDRSWKTFIIVIASLLCTVIVCLTINLSVNKITKNISANGANGNAQQGGQLVDDGQNGIDGTTDANGVVAITDAAGNTVATVPGATQASGNNAQGGSATKATQANATNPLNYSKAQIITYYNGCLNKSYAQSKMTAKKSERVSVTVDKFSFNGGENNSTIQSIANSIVSKNEKDTTNTKSFTNGKSSDGIGAAQFVLPTNLYANGVKSASVSKSGSGYQIVMTLVEEKCNFTTMPPANKSCAWPLNFNDIDLGGNAKITKADFYYPGTKLTANIDSQGRVSYVQVDMPLYVYDGTGEILIFPLKGKTLSASVHGTWVCKNTLTF